MLPYYELDSYPVLHDPLLRRARGPEAPRVCYAYGIAFGPQKVRVTRDTPRHCIDLEPTPQALTLSLEDQGRTAGHLDLLGGFLNEKGLPVRPGKTGLPGISVDRAYKLTDRLARVGAVSPHYIPPETVRRRGRLASGTKRPRAGRPTSRRSSGVNR